MAVHANGTPLTLTQISTEFGSGSSAIHLGQNWYVAGAAIPTFQFYGSPGSYTFTMPTNSGDTIIEVWGGGGSGGVPYSGITAGGLSQVIIGTTVITAYGGQAGSNLAGSSSNTWPTTAFSYTYDPNGGNGGTATGGDVNTTGGSAPRTAWEVSYLSGGTAGGAGGGTGGTGSAGVWNVLPNGVKGNSPGGGGGGTGLFQPVNDHVVGTLPLANSFSGGGGGGYAKKTMSLPAGTSISVTVGAGGPAGQSPGNSYLYNRSGAGAAGGVKISYNSTPLTLGTFPTTNLKFSMFFSKQATDPAGAGSTSYDSGNNTFVVPLFRNTIAFYAWGGGGGSNGGGTGGTSTVTLPSATLTATGGGSGGGGGRRYVGGSGGGGSGSGGTLNENGGSGAGGRGPGGDAGGIAYGGGTGGINPGGNFTTYPGNSPGGGGSGWFGYDGSPDPGYSGGGGAGGSGFSGISYSAADMPAGTSVNCSVGARGGNGGAGSIKIVWS